ncbi:branched-chain amino acid aminotransferase [Sphingomonas sp.]|jgi:branched-chain amino acid aminotransferase|uniref:branched-chain amino acid aminotransferase n=1 Tax=Sphingomonas sp. TaxID=28214 RepID=UPI002D7F3F3B|nr:branched-chain amino acid aminotransferase [Sphingomonas sp.]HEU0044828.1 branched-chain amino acid aminotransferase [Sphingomonas sp.]
MLAPAPPLFRLDAHPGPIAADERAVLIADPGFGRVFTDHMAVVNYSTAQGWHDARVVARAPLTVDPACAVLHYAQEIFEGLKAYRLHDGGFAMFRPEANARRFRDSARRMAMPELPEDLFMASLEALVAADLDWMPDGPEGALYLRPFMIASETFLGVKPASEYLYMVIASAAGSYWKGGTRPISLWVSHSYTRAAPGGTGAAKCGGNYATSLVAQAEATARGCDQVVFLDAAERRWIEELGGMNIFFVGADGSLLTPPLTGTILPGITRDSLVRLARDEGMTVREEPYAIEQWRADAESGACVEAFACGTAAVVTPIGRVAGPDYGFQIGDGQTGPVTARLLERLTAIQRGRTDDPHGWGHPLG